VAGNEPAKRLTSRGNVSYIPIFTLVLDEQIAKGEKADKQAHRKADPAKQGNPGHLAPARLCWQVGKIDQKGDRSEESDQLAQQQPGRNAQRDRLGEHARRYARERNTGIRKAEDRHGGERDRLMQRMLELAKRLVRGRCLRRAGHQLQRDRQGQHDAGERRVAQEANTRPQSAR
jgi:hypothetical protein